MPIRLACIQTNSQNEISANISAIAPMVAEATKQGAQVVVLPENAFAMEAQGIVPAERYAEEDHPGILAAREWAATHGIWLLIGSVAVYTDVQEKKRANRSLLISPNGKVFARYDKIHLFDVELPGGESYRESNKCLYGNSVTLAKTPVGNIGMTVCYDVRFPYLYRALAEKGAEILAVPAAFTYTTGSAHWHVLLRARAIENGCFVVAAAQCGHHPGGRRTYGHSLIIDPWGHILAEGSEDTPGIILADLDLAQVNATRARIPSLSHTRAYEVFEAVQK